MEGHGYQPQGRAAGKGTVPNTRRPSQRREVPPASNLAYANRTPFWKRRTKKRGKTSKKILFLPCCEPVLFCVFDAQNRVHFAWAKGNTLPAERCASPGRARKSQRAGTGSTHPHTHAHREWAADPGRLPQGRAAVRGGTPNPKRPHNGERCPPPGQPHAIPRACLVQWGTHTKGPVPGPHACTPAPTASGLRIPAACPKDGQPGNPERLAPDTPHDRASCPPPGEVLLPPPQRATPARKSVHGHCGAHAGAAHPHPPRPRDTGNRPRRVVGKGRAPNPRRPSSRREGPPRSPSRHPLRRAPPGRACWPRSLPAPRTSSPGRMGAQPQMALIRARAPSPTPAEDGQPGEGEHPTLSRHARQGTPAKGQVPAPTQGQAASCARDA